MYKSALESHESHESQDFDRHSIASSDNNIIDREDYYGDEVDESGAGPQWTWLTLGTCKLDPRHVAYVQLFVYIFKKCSCCLLFEKWRYLFGVF